MQDKHEKIEGGEPVPLAAAAQVLGELQAASEYTIVLTPEGQLAFWNALNETPRLTEAQRKLSMAWRPRDQTHDSPTAPG